MRSKHSILLLAVVFALSLSVSVVTAQETTETNSGWQFGASIYGWFPDISGQTTDGSGFQVDIEQILENLEFTMMGTFEVRKGHWGVLTDLIYMDVGGSQSDSGVEVDLDMESWIWNLAGSYRVFDRPGFVMDALAGARYLDVEQDLEWTGPGPGGSTTVGLTNVDGIIGIRGRLALGAKKALYVPYELDVGAGDSDLTWQGVTGLGYSFGWWELSAVWRYLYYDLSSDMGIDDLNFSGPAVGVAFRW